MDEDNREIYIFHEKWLGNMINDSFLIRYTSKAESQDILFEKGDGPWTFKGKKYQYMRQIRKDHPLEEFGFAYLYPKLEGSVFKRISDTVQDCEPSPKRQKMTEAETLQELEDCYKRKQQDLKEEFNEKRRKFILGPLLDQTKQQYDEEPVSLRSKELSATASNYNNERISDTKLVRSEELINDDATAFLCSTFAPMSRHVDCFGCVFTLDFLNFDDQCPLMVCQSEQGIQVHVSRETGKDALCFLAQKILAEYS